MTQFNGVISQLEQDLMADVKRQTEIIDGLNKAIAANIQAIVDEGGKAGEGVNQLGRAIVTSLTLEQKPADKGAKPATSQEIAKETDQQTQYMISASRRSPQASLVPVRRPASSRPTPTSWPRPIRRWLPPTPC
ncbi:hypothetical protein R5M74_08035 [Aeromonas hydrophila]|nr:hypothetical protein R5M74_08035 [Aeromonas hydrophila]